MDPIRTLLDRQPVLSAPILPEDLHKLYGGDLQFSATARPYVVANFAVTLDGVVSYKIPDKSGGAEITGRNAGDHFIMGLLRASADAVLVGSGTFGEVSPSHLWIPEYICPEAARLYRKGTSAQCSCERKRTTGHYEGYLPHPGRQEPDHHHRGRKATN